MTKEIELTHDKVALVDDDMHDYLNQWNWRAKRDRTTWYAMRSEGKWPREKRIYMHNEVISVPQGMELDHINRNGLDNRRENLRAVTHSDNLRNRVMPKGATGFRGVTWDKQAKRFVAQIIIEGRRVYLGGFFTAEEAARVYDDAAREHHREFARTNF